MQDPRKTWRNLHSANDVHDITNRNYLRINKHDGRKHPLVKTEDILAEFLCNSKKFQYSTVQINQANIAHTSCTHLRRAAILQNYPIALWEWPFSFRGGGYGKLKVERFWFLSKKENYTSVKSNSSPVKLR